MSPMKKQPDGIKRVARGDRKTGPDGKKLPPDQYDILLGKEYLGWTERMPRGKWNAYPYTGGKGVLLDNHTQAVQHLLDTHVGTQRVSEAGSGEETAQVAPAESTCEHGWPAGWEGSCPQCVPVLEHSPDDDCPSPDVPDIPFQAPEAPPDNWDQWLGEVDES